MSDKMKRGFFQVVAVSVLLYGCITSTLTKRPKKKLDGNNRTMLRALLNKSWKQHSAKYQLYGLYNYGIIFYINHFLLIIFYHSVWLGFELFSS